MKINIAEYIDKIKNYFGGAGKGEEKNFQLALNIIIIVLVNIAAVTFNMRCDLTRNNTYSLSEKSEEVVSNLKEDMKIKVFFSKDLPAQHSAVLRYLKDLLDEYDYYGNRHFSYEIVDDKDLEKQASDYGIQPVQSQEFVDDQVKLRRTYMALVLQHADLVEKLESVTETQGLEYKITSGMEKMAVKIDGLLALQKPMTLRLYLDSRLVHLPIDGIGKLQDQVKDAVQKSNLRNYDKIRLEIVDPSKDNSGASLTATYGLTRLQWKAMRDTLGRPIPAGDGVLGLVLSTENRFQRLDLDVAPSLFGNYVIAGADNLEDRINNAVGVILSNSTRVGYISGQGTADINDERSREGAVILKQLLSDKYEIVPLDIDGEDIPSGIGVIIVNGPREKFSDLALYRIDQFLMKGNDALFFIDSFFEMQMPQQQNFFQQQQPIVLPVTTGLEDMLAHYGITVNRDIVLDANSARINMGQMIKEYPAMPVILKDGLSRDSVITRYLNSAVFFKASSLSYDEKKLKDEGLAVTGLVSTSDDSWLMTGRIDFNPYLMEANRSGDMKSYPVAALLSGSFGSYFKNREIPVSAKDKKTAGPLTATAKLDATIKSGKTEIVVVGTSEISRSGFMIDSRKVLSRGRRDEVFSNDLLIHGMVDYLTGNDYIPEMQSKDLDFNPLDKTGDGTRTALKTVNIAGVPLLVILGGLLVWRRRRARKKALLNEFSKEV